MWFILILPIPQKLAWHFRSKAAYKVYVNKQVTGQSAKIILQIISEMQKLKYHSFAMFILAVEYIYIFLSFKLKIHLGNVLYH
jgi:hypothetical protein